LVAISHKTDCYQMTGYLLSSTYKSFSAVIVQILLFSPVITGYQKRTAIESDQP